MLCAKNFLLLLFLLGIPHPLNGTLSDVYYRIPLKPHFIQGPSYSVTFPLKLYVFNNLLTNLVFFLLLLPGWIRDNYDASAHGFRMYMDCLLTIATSDRQDYFTFFYQHWSLFPLSFQSKLQAVNYRLFVVERPKRWTSGSPKWKFEYTAVLKRQSWLFNQFKYTCEIRDLLQTYPDYRDGGIETAARVMAAGPELTESLGLAIGTKRTTHLLSKLAVPTVPPCPRGSSTRILKTQKK